jgi:hypothetical protein
MPPELAKAAIEVKRLKLRHDEFCGPQTWVAASRQKQFVLCSTVFPVLKRQPEHRALANRENCCSLF